MKTVRLTLTGTAPLLMHNSRLSNPLDPATKALKSVTSKRSKVDDDHEEIARLEFIGSLYFDPEAGPYIPADNIWRCLFDAAKKYKKGVRVKEALFVSSDINPLAYRGPRDAAQLWADENFRLLSSVKVGTARTMRCRPMFRQWAVEAEAIIDTALLDVAEVRQIAETAGQIVGVGDWRPRYGRFTAEVQEV